jgi:hypothetical protein
LYFKFDEGSGGSVADSSGNGNTGTLNGVTWAEGKSGYAGQFDGASDVTAADAPELNPANAVTVAAWIYINSFHETLTTRIVAKTKGTALSDRAYDLALNTSAYKSLRFGSSGLDLSTPDNSLSVNRWYYVVGVFDSATDFLGIYINGELAAYRTNPYTMVNTTGYVVRIGNFGASTPRYFAGRIDEVQIYDVALTAAEVKNLYNSYLVPKMFLRFDEGSGSAAHDSSENGNDGVVYGATWVNGKYGKALNFAVDSVDYVDCGSDDSLRPAAGLTVAAWIEQSATKTNFWELTLAGSEDGNYGYVLRGGRTTAPADSGVGLSVGNGSSFLGSKVAYPFLLNIRYRVVATVEADGAIKLYVNGAYIGSGGAFAGFLAPSTRPFYVGSLHKYPSRTFRGVIDEVQVCDYAWTAEDVVADYKYGLRKKLVITDVDGVEHVLPTSQCEANLNNGEASTVNFSLNDTNKHVRSWLTNGAIVRLYSDASPPATKLRFTGQIERRPSVQHGKNEIVLSAAARELFFIDIVNGVKVAETYAGMTVNAIVADLLGKYLPAGYGSHNINGPDVTIPLIHFNYRSLKECLDRLAALAGAQYRCSPELSVTWEAVNVASSGITLTDADISSPSSPTSYVKSIEDVANVVYGAFGIGGKFDFGTVSDENLLKTSVACGYYSYAQQFSFSGDKIKKIGINVKKYGNPPSDMFLYLRNDNGDSPGTLVTSTSIAEADVPTDFEWVYWVLDEPLAAGTYWLMINRTASDTNAYIWRKSEYWEAGYFWQGYDNGTSNWQLSEYSYPLSLRVFRGGMMLLRAHDSASESANRPRSLLIQDESVTDRETAENLVYAKLNELKNEKVALQQLKVLKIDALPVPGETVSLDLAGLGVDDDFLTQQLTLKFDGGNPCVSFMLALGDRLDDLSAYIIKLKNEAATLQVNGLVVDDEVYLIEDI